MRKRDPETGRFVAQESASSPPASTVELREEGVGGLREAQADGRALIDIITPGWGSSGYYSEQLIQRDGPQIYPSGTHMYIDHPSVSEERDRPERSVKDLAAVLREDARWDSARGALVAEATLFPDHREELRAKAAYIGVSIRAGGEYEEGQREGRNGRIITKLDEGYSVDFVTKAGRGGKIGALLESARQELEEGLSEKLQSEVSQALHTLAREKWGGAGTYVYVEDYDPDERWAVFAVSRDNSMESTHYRQTYTSTADGEITLTDVPVQVERAVRFVPKETNRSPSEEVTMDEKEVQERLQALEKRADEAEDKLTKAEEARDSEKERADRAEDALLVQRAEGIVAEALTAEPEEGEERKFPKLPERAIERATAAALKDKLPLDEDGKLDKDRLKERAVKAAKDEAEYLSETRSGTTGVKGLGESASPSGDGESTGDTKATERLERSFKTLGLAEETAKVAAEGR